MKQLKGRLPMTTLSTEPAFPVNGATSWYPGMTMRDYFAAQAMQGLAVTLYYEGYSDDSQISLGTKIAYQVADSMMEAREHKGGTHGTDV